MCLRLGAFSFRCKTEFIPELNKTGDICLMLTIRLFIAK